MPLWPLIQWLIIKDQAQRAINLLAEMALGRTSSGRTSRKTDCTGSFFENHVLGIMALLADTINDGKGPQPMLEKIRCVRAIRAMIQFAQTRVSSGLPQVRLICIHTNRPMLMWVTDLRLPENRFG